MIRNVILVVAVVSSLVASTAQADSRRGGGSRGWGGGGSRGWGGIGIGGSGFQLNIGRGGYGYGRGYGGWGGYGGGYNRGWGGGYYGGGYGSGYYSPGYYGQTYSSPNYYYAPSQVYTDSTVVPSGPQAPTFDGGSIVLTNPATNTETIEYGLNGQAFTMKPGQTQRFTHDRDWIVEFERGVSNNVARYGLKSTSYKFKRTSNGWELFEQADSRPTAGALSPPPTNDPVRSAERLQPADETRRKDSVPPPVPEADQPKAQEFTSPSDDPETTVRPRQVPQP
ncbi:MAG: hypothetical protein IAG10_15500 [Planctomycetaceae bacterium]|nr:hypothetical protein [Planctomycetaceae bacterium]